MSAHAHEIQRRRTFAIISHPDAGKTTLTEKLLLYGGVIQLAGAVKAKRGRSSAISDWMEMERERGISITTSVMQFPYRSFHLNLLDTPGHADFSEDTYRTLHAVDGAVMLLDCAKGVESQTRKLFRVCRQRSIPIFTFVNKMDRPGRDAFDLLGEVESVLEIGAYPITWPIFRDGVFRGVWHRLARRVYLFDADFAGSSAQVGAERPPVEVTGLEDPAVREALDERGYDRLRHDAELLEAAGDGFDRERFLEGKLSPMFFGSAINNFGLEAFLETFTELLPPPPPRLSDQGPISPFRDEFSGFVNPTTFLARDRTVVDEGFAGDVVGVHDTGDLEIGDTLTGGSTLSFEGIPSFAPEHFSRLQLVDPLRRKQFATGLEQLAQEGTVQLYRPPAGRAGELVLGALGRLQFEVVKYRLESEYGVEVRLEPAPYVIARWVSRADGTPVDLDALSDAVEGFAVLDVRGRLVMLFDREWPLRTAERMHPEYVFAETALGVVVRAA